MIKPIPKIRAARTALARLQTRKLRSTARIPKAEPLKAKSVWSVDDYVRELERAKPVGPAALPNADLLRVCQGGHQYITAHFLVDASPFIVELWRRIEEHRVRGVRTKAEACRLIGCSMRWAQMIVAGTAHDSNKHQTNKSNHGRRSGTSKPKSDEDYRNDIARHFQIELRLLMAADWPRFQEICKSLEDFYTKEATRRKQ